MRKIRLVLLTFGVMLATNAVGQEVITVSPDKLPAYWSTHQEVAPAYVIPAAIVGLEGCYVVGFTINSKGEVVDPQILGSMITTLRPKNGNKREADKFQRQQILDAIRDIRYQPAPANTDRLPVKTYSRPVVVVQLSLDQPNIASSVAGAKAAYKSRKQKYFNKCAAMQ